MPIETINWEEWRRLPLTVSLAQFCQWTGLDRKAVSDLRKRRKIRTLAIGNRHRYLKS
jgi:hypothetical protein